MRNTTKIKIIKEKNRREVRSVIEIDKLGKIGRKLLAGGLKTAFGAVGFSYVLPPISQAKLLGWVDIPGNGGKHPHNSSTRNLPYPGGIKGCRGLCGREGKSAGRGGKAPWWNFHWMR